MENNIFVNLAIGAAIGYFIDLSLTHWMLLIIITILISKD